MMNYKFFIPLLLFVLSACLPQQEFRAPVSTEFNANKDNDPLIPPSSNQPQQAQDAHWRNNNLTLQSLTINFDNNKDHLIFGADIDAYLNRTAGVQGNNSNNNPIFNYYYEKSYCIQINFTAPNNQTPRQLRARAIPASTLNAATGVRTRYFRVHLSDSLGNDFCNKNIHEPNGIVTSPPANLAYKASDVCSGCQNIINSSSVRLLKYDPNTTNLLPIEDTRIKASGLSLRIDYNGNAGSGTSTCTNSQCNAQGFDCCINGQCVNNKSVILSGISADPNGFAQAEAEKEFNSTWYLNYPQFYYACLELPPNDNTTDPLDPEDPAEDANERLQRLYSEYKCIEDLRREAIDQPYIRDYLGSSLPSAQSNFPHCSFIASDDLYYKNVLKNLFNNCGCAEKEDLALMSESCPAYYYKVEYQKDNQGNITNNVKSVSCFTPPVDLGPLPFEDRDVKVSSRTAPHRFFNQDGKEFELVGAFPSNENSMQEGDEFKYLDSEKLFPQNGNYNMNSILGQIKVNLSAARPAKVIDVEFDKTYYLAALDGTHTPCPSCSKDSWFSNFSAFPTTHQGLGVRASGFTTSRNEWRSNLSLANYEDNIFGRACWVPPTMLPFSHRAINGSHAQAQRLNRLKTQAALYVNGYQRDWFGFNKGALIGSFDGVTWFAIGKNRVARATSNKLFLAINAPFADLTNPNDNTIHVAEYDFISTAAKYDYKDTSEINDNDQNEAGLCQRYHQCNNDTDCITQLGWEYVCANVNAQRTKWPQFEADGAVEISDAQRIGRVVEFLQQGELPQDTPTQKRCIYRGAGSPCRVDYENISNIETRKTLACAPNFYCASLNSNVFNREVARFGNSLDVILEPKNHLIGQDANVLGRPKSYLGQTSSLPSDVINTLKDNLVQIDNDIVNNEGICRPGKSLPDYDSPSTSTNINQVDQHKSADPQGRTDFISQIAGCNSTLYNIYRYSSCPILDTDGNYLHTKASYINSSSNDLLTQVNSLEQNACGLENIDENTMIGPGANEEVLRSNSAFRQIKARDLSSSDTQIEPILAQNACLRRAGSVCHTDLDCSPGKKHFQALEMINPDLFGNLAERKYWEEYLICGQRDPEPIISALSNPDQIAKYNNWDMSKNRCCREVGKDITMYTEDVPNVPESFDIRTDIYGGVNANDPRRYSRYMSSFPAMDTAPFANNSAFIADGLIRPSANTQRDASGYLLNSVNITNPNQWKTIADTGSKTCCGGGWIRKFSDGTNDWTQNRLNIDVNNFKCLNYITPLYLTENPGAYSAREQDLNLDSQYLCVDANREQAGCAQPNFPANNSSNPAAVIAPKLNDVNTRIKIDSNLSPSGPMQGLWDDSENLWAFFGFFSSDEFSGENSTILNWTNRDAVEDNEERKYLAVRVPSFITFQNSNYANTTEVNPNPLFNQSNQLSLTVRMNQPDKTAANTNPISCERLDLNTIGGNTNCANGVNAWFGLCEGSNFHYQTWESECNSACCFGYNQSTRELRVAYNIPRICENNGANNCYDPPQGGQELYYGSGQVHSLEITFSAAGTYHWERQQRNRLGFNSSLDNIETQVGSSASNDNNILHHIRSSEPGNMLYYLKRLAKLEYLGIPQMTYEPIFCNDIYQKMVPGIFKNDLDIDNNGILTSYDWFNSPYTFIDPNAQIPWSVGSNASGSSLNYVVDPIAAYGSDTLKRVTTSEFVDHPKIFSENEFKCCAPLGSKVHANEGASRCCSGYSSPIGTSSSSSSEHQCSLPLGVNLHVYFNKFVSNEGTEELEDNDFDLRTGEPKVTLSVQNKIRKLGEKYCEGGNVNIGGAFGEYRAEPIAPIQIGNSSNDNVFQILDSLFDGSDNQNSTSGFEVFSDGLRWNHHLYCSPELN